MHAFTLAGQAAALVTRDAAYHQIRSDIEQTVNLSELEGAGGTFVWSVDDNVGCHRVYICPPYARA